MDPFIGEIRCFSFGKIPVGWLPCDGRVMQIQQNQALYSLLGNKYGGDGVKTFALPNLRGVTPIHYNPTGTAPNPQTFVGGSGGAETVALTQAQMPAHNHLISVSNETPTGILPTSDYPAELPSPHQAYASPSSSTTPMAADFVSTTGGGRAHTNMQPYAVVNYCIATMGNYPPRP